MRLRHTRIGVNFHDVYVRSGLSRTLALPDEVGDDVAASVLLRGLTADMRLRRVHAVGPGDWILVQAAAGGVGLLPCRWAVHLGARVIGTVAQPGQADVATQAGCPLVLDSRRDDFVPCVREATGSSGVAVAYDGVGRDTFDRSLQSLDFCGHLVNFGQASEAVAPFDVSRLAARSSSLTRPIIFHHLRDAAVREAMAGRLFGMLAAGVLRVGAPRWFALADAAQSHRVLGAEGATRPLLLVP